MISLRISVGSASCKSYSGNDPSLLAICSAVSGKIQYLKSQNRDQLDRWRETEMGELIIGDKIGMIIVYKTSISEEKDVIVVQGFLPTWRSPNYFSLGRVGRIFAEGFYVDTDGRIEDVEEDDLWSYR